MVRGAISLHVVSGVKQGASMTFEVGNRVTIGRTKVSKLQIKDSVVSQKHAVVEFKNGRWFLTDCHSSNGTSMNGTCVDPEVSVELRDGDSFVIGIGSDNTVTVRIDAPGNIDVSKAATTGMENLTVEGRPPYCAAECELEETGIIDAREHAEQLKNDVFATSGAPVREYSKLTVKEWFHQEGDRLAANCESKAEAVITELKAHAEQLKKDICAASGVHYESIVCLKAS